MSVKRKSLRVLSVFLCVVMLVTMVPVAAFAAASPPAPIAEIFPDPGLAQRVAFATGNGFDTSATVTAAELDAIRYLSFFSLSQQAEYDYRIG